MDEGDDEYVDPNLYSAFGVDSVLNVPASPIRGAPGDRAVEQTSEDQRPAVHTLPAESVTV